MARLPLHHVPRPRLTARCADETVVVVEAGAGYGKTVFGAELVDHWQAVGVEVVLLGGDVSAALLVARLQSAVARAGYTEAAAAMASAGDDPAGAVDVAVDGLAAEHCVFVVDDAHHLQGDAGLLLNRLATRLGRHQRLVVLARHLPEGAGRLRHAEHLQLTAADMALRPEETAKVCQEGFRLAAGGQEIRALHEATGGWTAAAVLGAARAQRTGESLLQVAGAARRSFPMSSAVGAMLDDAIGAFDPAGRTLLAQLGHIPILDRAAIDLIGGDDFFQRVTRAGLPLTPGAGDWYELPGSVRDHLASLAPIDAGTLRSVADDYARRGLLTAALQLLLVAGDGMAAAALLAGAAPSALDRIDVLELRSVVEGLTDEAIQTHPVVLVHLVRSLDAVSLLQERELILQRAERLVLPSGDGPLLRAIAAERCADRVREGRYEESEAAASAILAAAAEDEWLTRARALSLLGRAVCWRRRPDGRRDLDAMAQSDLHLAAAAAIYRRVGMRSAEAGTIPYRAMWIDFAMGRPESALGRLDDGLSLVVDRPRRWALLLISRAEVAMELGRYEECEANVADVHRVAEAFNDQLLRAYAYWDQAISASHRGDADATVELVRLVERNGGEWLEAGGADFYADAAEQLARVGHTALAWEFLRRAQAEPMDGEPIIAMAEAALLARYGDPDEAERCLLAAPGHRVDPREAWRITLLRAYAAFRRGDRAAGALAARAFEEAAALGLDHLPLTKERAITEELLGLAAETGQPAAVALESASLPVTVSVLGRFELTRAGRPVVVRAGQATQLVKLLAVCGGRLVSDRVIDVLWPDASLHAGRNRLRTVLNRLRVEAGDLIVRDGETLALAPAVHTDLARFEAEARRALALAPGQALAGVAVARAAISHYRGELLPDDLYEDWAQLPRDRARRTMLELLDLCADVAAERGHLDELRRIVDMSIDMAPYDDERYLRGAFALLQQGQRGAALSVVKRARHALAELGLAPPSSLLRLEQGIVA